MHLVVFGKIDPRLHQRDPNLEGLDVSQDWRCPSSSGMGHLHLPGFVIISLTVLLALSTETLQILAPAVVHIRGTASMPGGHLFTMQMTYSILVVNGTTHIQVAFRVILVPQEKTEWDTLSFAPGRLLGALSGG